MLGIPAISEAVGTRVIPGGSHEELQDPKLVYDIAYRRESAVDTGQAGWVAEIVLIVWHTGYDEALSLAEQTLAVDGIGLTFSSANVRHLICVNAEPFQVDIEPSTKLFGVLMRFEAFLDN